MVKNKKQLRTRFRKEAREKAEKSVSPYFMGEELNKKVDGMLAEFLYPHPFNLKTEK